MQPPPPPPCSSLEGRVKNIRKFFAVGAAGSEMFIFGGDYIVAGMGGVRGRVILK